jgi:ribosomal-protein-alanine N-acetyltransferase
MIIPLAVAHLPVLAEMHAACFPAEPWDDAALRDVLGSPGVFGFIDERGGFLILRVAMDEAEVISIGAVPRRQGIGRALLEEGLARLRAQDVVAVYLEVAEDNEAARALYTGLGFEKVGRRRRYYADGTDALTMRLGLA